MRVVNWIESAALSEIVPNVALTSACAPPELDVSLSEYSSITPEDVAVIVATFWIVSVVGPPELLWTSVTEPLTRVYNSSESPVSPDAAVREALVAPLPMAAQVGLFARFGAPLELAPPDDEAPFAAHICLNLLVVTVAVPNAIAQIPFLRC